MELPKYNETFIPILEILNTKSSLHRTDLFQQVRDKHYLNLPQELLNKKTTTGASTVINRIAWGVSYLKIGKFLTYPTRGIVQITKKGKEALKKGALSLVELKNDPDFLAHEKSKRLGKESELIDESIESASPQDLIDKGFYIIEEQVKAELLEKLKIINPYYFEKVILILLKKMRYGDFLETSKSGDGGIDGIINEDKLGIEKIYIQAKRYNGNKVRETEIRNFIGAMSGDTNKGVFVTTSNFDDSAIKKAREAHHKIILIDGNKLIDLMHQYNVGIQVKNTYEIKEIDEDFFEGS